MAFQDGFVGIGQDVGPYRIEALIAAGGMGIVYRARDRQLERTVAIKVVNRRQANADSARCLLQEARLAAALDHPSVCTIHEVGFFGDQSFIVMEHVEGTALTALIPAGRGRPADRRSDVWALGVLLYEMAGGRRPFAGATRYELAAAILADPVAPLPREVAAPVRRVAARSLMKNPSDRYQCATEAAAALDDSLF